MNAALLDRDHEPAMRPMPPLFLVLVLLLLERVLLERVLLRPVPVLPVSAPVRRVPLAVPRLDPQPQRTA